MCYRFYSHLDCNEVEEMIDHGVNLRDVLQNFIETLIVITSDLEHSKAAYQAPFEE